jgi:hypothetical protein
MCGYFLVFEGVCWGEDGVRNGRSAPVPATRVGGVDVVQTSNSLLFVNDSELRRNVRIWRPIIYPVIDSYSNLF